MAQTHKVRIVNPARRRKPKKKAAPMPRNKKGQYVKKKRSRRRRRRNPGALATTAAAPAPRRRRRRAAANPKRRRRRNPSNGGGGLTLRSLQKDLPWAIFGKLIQAYGVRRFGDPMGQGMFGLPGASASPYAGQPWTFRNYFTAMASSWIGAQMIKRWKGAHEAHVVWRSGIEDIATRFVWTEIIGRSPQAQQMFGQGLPGWSQVGPMGGYGQLVEAGPMGQLVEAGPMGHYVDPDDTSKAAMRARYQGTGSTNPYQAVYDYRGVG